MKEVILVGWPGTRSSDDRKRKRKPVVEIVGKPIL